MIYIIYISIIFFISCESLHENIAAPLYHDSVAYGWQYFFAGDYDEALNWFETAYSATDEDYHNSAHVGKAWTYLYKSNLFIDSDSSKVEELRELARTEFSYKENESKAIESYDSNCMHTYCCKDCFKQDRTLGYLVDQLELKTRDSNASQLNDEIDELVDELIEFINNNDNYDLMAGKPTSLSEVGIEKNINNVIIYLAQVYLRIDQIEDACNLLKSSDLECYDDCNNIDFDIFYDCVESYSPIY